jgi:outer membrane protein W
MLWRKMVLVAIVFYSIAAPYAYAQRSFEVTPFFGGRFGGRIDEGTSINPTVPFDHILFKNSFDYGGLFDYTLFPNVKAEFMFNRQPTVLTGHDVASNTSVNLANVTLDKYEWGIQYAFGSPEAKLKPYIVGGAGFTHFDPSALLGFSNHFSYNLGGGVTYLFSDHFGLRMEARWLPTHITSGLGLVCSPFIACFQTTLARFAEQGQVNLGFILRFK